MAKEYLPQWVSQVLKIIDHDYIGWSWTAGDVQQLTLWELDGDE